MMNETKKRCTAIILAAGSGSRMKSKVAKQYMLLEGKPLIWYALSTVEQSKIIDDCILVTGAEDVEYVRRDIVEHFEFRKVQAIVPGGTERFLSVANALEALAFGGLHTPNNDGYVFIHDGARPFLTEEILERTYAAVIKYHACVAAMPSKDTVKLVDEDGFAVETPDRRHVWNIQTPQVFDVNLIQSAYEKLRKELPVWEKEGIVVTDDASVIERFTDSRVKLVKGSYENIKITTPEDLRIAGAFLEQKKNN